MKEFGGRFFAWFGWPVAAIGLGIVLHGFGILSGEAPSSLVEVPLGLLVLGVGVAMARWGSKQES